MFFYKVYEQNNKELVVFWVVKTNTTDVFLQSIWAKQQRISSFLMFFYKVYEQNNKELVVFWIVKNKNGVSCINEYYYDRCSFLSSKKQKREILKHWALTFWVKQFILK